MKKEKKSDEELEIEYQKLIDEGSTDFRVYQKLAAIYVKKSKALLKPGMLKSKSRTVEFMQSHPEYFKWTQKSVELALKGMELIQKETDMTKFK